MSPSYSPYSLVEPHPKPPTSSRLPTGRGGAGNYATATHSTWARTGSSSSTRPRLSSTSTPANKSHFLGGRGGAGNLYSVTERAIFSFDEELEHERRLAEGRAPVFSVGRGGSGNRYTATATASSQMHNDDYGVGGSGTRIAKARQSSASSNLSLSSVGSSQHDSASSSSGNGSGRRSLSGMVRKMAPRGSFVGKVMRE